MSEAVTPAARSFAIQYQEKPGPHRLVMLKDPAGKSMLHGSIGKLAGDYVMGGYVTKCLVRFGGGVEAHVSPTWITDLPLGPHALLQVAPERVQ